MTTEKQFDYSTVEPAKVNFIETNDDVQDEHLDESTPAIVKDTPTAPVAPEAQAPDTPQVHADQQDSERYKNLQAAYTKATQEKSELLNRIEQLEARLAQPIPQQHVQQPEPATPAEPDELDITVEEFPELKPFASSYKKIHKDINALKTTISDQKESIAKTAQEIAQEKQNNVILTAHPDAYAITGSVDFNGWLARQPSYMQPWLRTGTAEQVIDLIQAYKVAASQQPAKQDPPPEVDPLAEARIAGAPSEVSAPILNTDHSNKKRWTEAEIKAMSFAEYQTLEQELDLAAREGRIDP